MHHPPDAPPTLSSPLASFCRIHATNTMENHQERGYRVLSTTPNPAVRIKGCSFEGWRGFLFFFDLAKNRKWVLVEGRFHIWPPYTTPIKKVNIPPCRVWLGLVLHILAHYNTEKLLTKNSKKSAPPPWRPPHPFITFGVFLPHPRNEYHGKSSGARL